MDLIRLCHHATLQPATLTMNQPEPFPKNPNSKLARAADGLVNAIARHWLAIFNTIWGTYLLLPILAPILLAAGLQGPSNLIYWVYSVLCHQLPDHSYFFFGNTPVPLLPELEAHGMAHGLNLWEQRRFVGNEIVGYKTAICQRDIAIYGSVFMAGLLFNVVRHRLYPINFKLYLLFLVPITVDGLTQLVGLHQSNWWLRTVTGALFGGASIWLAYPHVEAAMQDTLNEPEYV